MVFTAILPSNRPLIQHRRAGGTSTYDCLYGAVSVDDGQAVVLTGKSRTSLFAVKLDSDGNKQWEWEVRVLTVCSLPYGTMSDHFL